tara:strand:- start:2460 stop:2759 length:300 start_codon:yes stop_codon:yes gene_type:complete
MRDITRLKVPNPKTHIATVRMEDVCITIRSLVSIRLECIQNEFQNSLLSTRERNKIREKEQEKGERSKIMEKGARGGRKEQEKGERSKRKEKRAREGDD